MPKYLNLDAAGADNEMLWTIPLNCILKEITETIILEVEERT